MRVSRPPAKPNSETITKNGIPDQSFDGLPQFSPATGAPPQQGPAPSNASCSPSSPSPGTCIPDPTNLVTSFHLHTVCTENTSPFWLEIELFPQLL